EGERLDRCRGVAEKRGEEGALRLRRVVEIHCFAREQHRPVDARLYQRFRTELAGERNPRLVLRRPALQERDEARRDSECEQDDDADQERTQSPYAALALDAACVEERALGLGQLALVLRRPVERTGEPGAAVELGWVAAARRPLSGAGGEMSME